MPESFVQAPGERQDKGDCSVSRAVELVDYLQSAFRRYAALVEFRKRLGTDEADVIVIDLEVEVSQERAHDIRGTERVALVFTRADELPPEVLALRVDFPRVPHLNLRESEVPRSLCLYDQSWDELKLRWTAANFVERIREWLRLSAAGNLHQGDQSLEPIVVGSSWHLIIPSDLFADKNIPGPEKLEVWRSEDGVLQALRPGQAGQRYQGSLYLAISLRCKPQQHGIIRQTPSNLLALHELTVDGGDLNLLNALREHLSSWERAQAPLTAQLILIVFFPKTRSRDAAPEAHDIWAFLIDKTVQQIGEAIGIWGSSSGVVGRLIGVEINNERARDVSVTILNPISTLSREGAAMLNGTSAVVTPITAIGAGALGSQVIPNLVRSGYGTWTVIDHDLFLPHNGARHELTGALVGAYKSAALRAHVNTILDKDSVTEFVVANVLRPGQQAAHVTRTLVSADVIADFSASVPVARHLVHEVKSDARRLSLFLSPTGRDLVLLVEDRTRTIPLDTLEMQYYREVASNPELRAHLDDPGRIRYARSCRDLTSTIPADLASLHAAIGSRAIRSQLAIDQASITIWTTTPEFAVRLFRVEPSPVEKVDSNIWTLRTDRQLINKIADFRKCRLPNETGGILIGSFDLQRKIVYVVDTIFSPLDSIERPVLYIRGCEGLEDAVAEVARKTAGMLEYVGEWHSHPDGYEPNPSQDDRAEFTWLKDRMGAHGLPALMLIVGQSRMSWLLDKIG